MKLKVLVASLSAAALIGCEARQMSLTSPDLGSLGVPDQPISERDIVDAFDKRPPVRPNTNIGVVYVPPTQSGAMETPQAITAEDRKAWETTLRDNYFIKDVIFLSTLFSPSMNVRDVRLLRKNAATLNCDLLLIYGVSCDYSRQANPLALLYLTIIGAFIVPGDSVTTGCMAKAALMDVRSGYVYGVVEGAATRTMALPVGWIGGSLPRMYEVTAADAVRKARENIRPLLTRLRDEAAKVVD